jgi:hypothetical protein
VISRELRKFAGILFLVLPTVMYGGVSLLQLLLDDPRYPANALRQDLWRAGHAHAGVLLLLSFVVLLYLDLARPALGPAARRFVRSGVPAAAILMPAGFFLSVLDPAAREPNRLILLTYAGAVILALAILTLGIGLVRRGEADGR